jgi:hypothetical protein
MTQRYYSETQVERAAKQVELWQEQLARAYRRDLWDLAKTEQSARDRLLEPNTVWGSHETAKAYLEVDVPNRRRCLHAALHILDFGAAQMRIDFVLGDKATRERLVQWVIERGGIYDYASGRKPAPWVELAY